jgi:hypothetical protein
VAATQGAAEMRIDPATLASDADALPRLAVVTTNDPNLIRSDDIPGVSASEPMETAAGSPRVDPRLPASPIFTGQAPVPGLQINLAAAGTSDDPSLKPLPNGSSTPLLTLGSYTNLDTLRVLGLDGTDTFTVTTADDGRSLNVDGGPPSGKKKSTDNLNMLYTPPRPTIIHSPATKDPVAGIVDLDYGTARFVVQYD